MRRIRVTPLGVVLIAVVVGGVVLGIVGSKNLQVAGLVIAALALALIAASQLSVGDSPFGFSRRFMPFAHGEDPAPDYIAEAGTPSEEAWNREEERYHERLSQPSGETRPDEK